MYSLSKAVVVFLLQNHAMRFVTPLLLFGVIFGAIFAGVSLREVYHQIEIGMNSDHYGSAQLFWKDRSGRYKEDASSRRKLKLGANHFRFTINKKKKFDQFRFDPTEKKNGKFEILYIRYIYKRNFLYQLPLDRIKDNVSSGISYINVSPDKVSMVAQNNDPVLLIDMKNMVKIGECKTSSPAEAKAPYVWILIVSFAVWIILLHGLQKYWLDYYPYFGRVVLILAKTVYLLLFAAYLFFLWINTVLLGKVTCALVLLYGIKYVCFREWKKEKTPEVVKANFDWGMHYFRAFAISCICFGHTCCAAGRESWSWMYFQADSIYFIFISGYLAQYLFFKKPDTPMIYYKKKVINVISPYIVFSCLILTFLYFTHPYEGLFRGGTFTVKNVALAFCFGRAAVAYWYIPFVTILFMVTPLLVRLSANNFMRVFFVFAALAIVFPQRGGFKTFEYFIYLYTYFTVSYLWGMAFSRYREKMDYFFQKIHWYALFMAIGIGILIAWNPKWHLKISDIGLLCSFQKILFTIFLIVILGYLKNKKISLLNALANYSFTIFFIHLIFYQDYQNIYAVVVSYANMNKLMAFITGIIFLLHMLLLSILLKKIIGKHSRYFIGS